MTWLYNGKEIADSSQVPEKSIGFIYLITQISSGKKYIGRKLLTKAATKTVKGVKKKLRVESDWQNYWSSSPDLLELIQEIGTNDFRREILAFVETKSELMYAEEYALYASDALLSENYFNSSIRSKIMRKWFEKSRDHTVGMIEELKKKL